MSAWIGCGECNIFFSCYEGKTRCVRLAAIPIEGDTAYHRTADNLMKIREEFSPTVFRSMLVYELASAALRAREATELRMKGK